MFSLSKKLTDCYVKRNDVEPEKIQIYEYGFKLIVSDIINFLIVLGIGLFCEKLWMSVSFLVVLCSIRVYSGGYHSKSFIVCRLSMIATLFCVLFLTNIIDQCVNNILDTVLLINLFSILSIIIYSPVEHSNKPLNARQKKANKNKASIISSIFAVMSICMVDRGIKEGITISLTILAVNILMFIGLIVRKRGEKNV